ncbi:cytochrome c-type biogenesis protein CcmH [Cellulosimicrobium sp. NPDC057127]|uniref:cytochrome c-type biogenesis protein CcmH n=1 Tax=Cellulosimicrobium sp. NPDC057127 TaxID=3346026 RepID=UPI00363723DE
MTRRATWWCLAALVVVALLGVGAGALTAGPAGADAQVRAVASTLRCPSCAGEDVADSAAPVAASMRTVIAEQLDEGRTPPEIRAWFADAYGDDVLLDPPRRGAGWAFWLVPVAVLGVAGVLVLRRARRRWVVAALAAAGVAAVLAPVLPTVLPDGPSDRGTADDPAPAAAGPDTAGVLAGAVAAEPGRAELRAALARRLAEQGRHDEAAAEYDALVRLRPLDADARYRGGFAHARAGDVEQAVASLEAAVELDPEHASALLLLGTLVAETDPDRSAELLARHDALEPAAPEATP